MSMSLWSSGKDWAICDGPGPLNVAGYIFEYAGGGWGIRDDQQNRRFLDQESAAATVLGQDLASDLRYYLLQNGDGVVTVLTYPEVHERIVAEGGWTTVASARTLVELSSNPTMET